MKITKNLIGPLLLPLFNSAFVSCRSDFEECPFYDVVVSNCYFEPLDSVCFNKKTVLNMEIAEQQIFNNVPHGKQIIRFYTQSKLEISAYMNLLGDTKRVYVSLTELGQICIE